MTVIESGPDRAPEKGDYRAPAPSADRCSIPSDAKGWPILKSGCNTCRGMGFVAVEPPSGATFADGYCPECNGPEVRAVARANLARLKAVQIEQPS